VHVHLMPELPEALFLPLHAATSNQQSSPLPLLLLLLLLQARQALGLGSDLFVASNLDAHEATLKDLANFAGPLKALEKATGQFNQDTAGAAGGTELAWVVALDGASGTCKCSASQQAGLT
jgi:hypothetical protein